VGSIVGFALWSRELSLDTTDNQSTIPLSSGQYLVHSTNCDILASESGKVVGQK